MRRALVTLSSRLRPRREEENGSFEPVSDEAALLAASPGLWGRSRYRRLAEQVRRGALGEALTLLAAGRAQLGAHEELDGLGHSVCLAVTRREASRLRRVPELLWDVCDPDGRYDSGVIRASDGLHLWLGSPARMRAAEGETEPVRTLCGRTLAARRESLVERGRWEAGGRRCPRCQRALRARGERFEELTWRREPTGPLSGAAVDDAAASLSVRLGSVMAEDPSLGAVRDAARAGLLELVHARAMAVVGEPEQADRLLRALLPADGVRELAAERADGLAVVGLDPWRLAFSFVLAELTRGDAAVTARDRSGWLRGKVRGELLRTAKGRSRPPLRPRESAG